MSQQRRPQRGGNDQNRRSMVQAKHTFICEDGTVVDRGDLADSRSEIVRAHPDAFGEPRVRFAAPRTETATPDR